MDIVEKFPAGIHTVIGTKGVYLSGGEQQRIAIALSLIHISGDGTPGKILPVCGKISDYASGGKMI